MTPERPDAVTLERQEVESGKPADRIKTSIYLDPALLMEMRKIAAEEGVGVRINDLYVEAIRAFLRGRGRGV